MPTAERLAVPLCPHRTALIHSASRLLAAYLRGNHDVRAAARHWLIEKDRCTDDCTTCSKWPQGEGRTP